MGSAVGGMQNVKIFVLYLMENVGRPLDFVTLNDIVMQTDFVMYLDFAEAFHKMLDDGLIAEEGKDGEDVLYGITEKGRTVAESLHSDILSSILDKSLTAALRYLDFKRRGVKPECNIQVNTDGSAEFSCRVSEQGRVLFETSIHCDCLARAEQMERNFHERPEAIYKGLWALLSGNVNCLFS